MAELEKVLDVSGIIVTMKVGNSVLRLKPTAIELSAHEITLTSSGALKLKGSGDIVLKGQKIHEN